MKAKLLLPLLIVIVFSACKKTKNEPIPEPVDPYIADNSFKIVAYKMSVASLDQWLIQKKMPKEKAVVGIPLYGRSSTNGSKGYRDIEASGADINLNLATVDGIAYGFNGISLVKQKVDLAKTRANGIMFWEFSHDTNNANSLVKAANDQLGRAY